MATDINPRYLDKARNGIYSNWSFRETPANLREKYFRKVGNNWLISEKVREMVVFQQLNLVEDSYPSHQSHTTNMDFIFCRNVLMYFSSELITLVSRRFLDALKPQGWLITSAVELNDLLFSSFTKVNFGKAIFYRKTNQKLLNYRLDNLPDESASSSRRLPDQSKKYVKAVAAKPAIYAHHRPSAQAPEFSSMDMAERLFRGGDYAECADTCNKELLINNNQPLLWILLIKSYANMGQLDNALDSCSQLITLDSFNSEAYYLMATVLIEKQELSDAVAVLQKGIYINHDHLMSHFIMSNLLDRLSDKSGAAIHRKNVKRILSGFDGNHILDEAEGLTVRRMIELVNFG